MSHALRNLPARRLSSDSDAAIATDLGLDPTSVNACRSLAPLRADAKPLTLVSVLTIFNRLAGFFETMGCALSHSVCQLVERHDKVLTVGRVTRALKGDVRAGKPQRECVMVTG